VVQEVEEEELEVPEREERTGPSTAEPSVVNLLRMANCRLTLLPSFPDNPFSIKVLPHSRPNLVLKDAVCPNPQLPTSRLVLTTILTTVTTNVPFAPARSSAIQRCGHVILAGPSSTCLVSRSGLRTRDLPLLSSKVERMAKYPLLDNGDALDVTFRKTPYQRRTPAGARKKLSRAQSLVCLLILAETLVVEKESANVLILVN
jgi:hypothetical protein